MVVLEEESLLYCTVPLVGSGPWLKLLYLLGPHGRGLSDISSIPSKEVTSHKNFVYLSSFPQAEQERRLHSYTKVMISRHPFTRLTIAYKMKFEARNAFFHERYGKKIVSNFRHSLQGTAGTTDGSDVTFAEFVEYVTRAKHERDLNEHWQPLASLCAPCEVGYDVILHHETLKQDSNELLSKLGLAERVSFPHDTWDYVAAEYVYRQLGGVAPASVGRLVQRYWDDFELFSYSSSF